MALCLKLFGLIWIFCYGVCLLLVNASLQALVSRYSSTKHRYFQKYLIAEAAPVLL